jgi:hypothetical protein
MAISAGGWVEVKTAYSGWVGAIHVDQIINQSYDVFGCLFGVANHTGLRPPVPIRGLPVDLSLEATNYGLNHLEEGGALYETWITWLEAKNMDLDEVGVDGRAHYYKRGSDGSLIYQNTKARAPNTPEDLYPGLTWERNDMVYKIHTITRREILDTALGWQMLVDMMKALERNWIDTDIRLVMWFW